MPSFTTTELQSGGVLVTGTDINGDKGRTVLKSPVWDAVKQSKRQQEAAEKVDAVIEQMLAPLNEVLNEIAEDLDDSNDWRTYIINEGAEGEPTVGVTLDDDGVLLRLLAETDGSMLIWVNETTLDAIKS
jgi:hypothetical protein